MEFKKFNKIGQFKQAVYNIRNLKQQDENGQYVDIPVKPTIEFNGTVKLHGTNSGFSIDNSYNIKGIKRNSFVSEKDSHFGFRGFLSGQSDSIVSFYKDVKEAFDIKDHEQLNVYGEWAGENIQGNVAISEGHKSFYLFSANITSEDKNNRTIDVYDIYKKHFFDSKTFNHIQDFISFKMVIDFNKPEEYQNQLHDITKEIEKECPVAKSMFNVSGIGEGVVWTSTDPKYPIQFKVVGEAHTKTKVKTIVPVDLELLKSVNEFVEYAVTENRVNQAIQEVGVESKKDTGKFLNWITDDIFSEEQDTLINSKLKSEEVLKAMQNKARTLLFGILDKV